MTDSATIEAVARALCRYCWSRDFSGDALDAYVAAGWKDHAAAAHAAISAIPAQASDDDSYDRGFKAGYEAACAARVPKVRTSHHRNAEEAIRLQALVDVKYGK